MLRVPQISVDGLSTLKPELIGLAAWLGVAYAWSLSNDRTKILGHVGATGSLDGLETGLMTESQLAAAKVAHREWLDFLAAIAATPVRPLLPSLSRNGHYRPVPDDCGDDIAF
jgi:hypothetical protein